MFKSSIKNKQIKQGLDLFLIITYRSETERENCRNLSTS